MSEKRKRGAFVAIIGCGRLGANIASALSEQGQGVVVLDSLHSAFRRLPSSFGGITLTGDATDPDVLQEARIAQADAVVVVTNSDNTNIMVAQMVREMYGVLRVIVRLYDPERECVYQELGIETISPVVLSMNEVRELLDQQEDAE